MSIRIDITDATARETPIKNKVTKAPVMEQVGWAYLCNRVGTPDPHPTRIKFLVDEPHAVGSYTVHPSSFYPGDYSSLRFTLRLTPVKPKA